MEHLKGFISLFMSAISNCILYSKNHAVIDELIEDTFSKLGIFLKGTDHFEIMIIENDLIINKNPAIGIGLQGKNLIKRLKRKGISHIEFSKGTTLQELKKLVVDISNMGKELKSTPHIKIGTVDLRFSGFTSDGDSSTEKNLSNFTPDQLRKIEEEINSISPFKKLNVAGFEEIVFQFVQMLKNKINILKLLRPVQANNGLDYNHATNVAVLTLFQAQALGIKEEFHQDIGLAALLHDVGKLFVQKEMHNKKSSPGAKESELMKLHPFYGAQYLANIKDLTHLAPIVAFQHHLRYDGRGYPQLKTINIKQHICSQMTAISDSFDNLRITTRYGSALNVKDALITMKTKDEGLFNPFLIDNFIRSIHLALSV
jgi:HD-GYP domain-containing protein (c-di-GMP phosphodiesterase class II)